MIFMDLCANIGIRYDFNYGCPIMDKILQPLQAHEALQLAIHASEKNDYDRAIGYLTNVLQREPIHPELYYFLGIQYAELELYERAIAGLQKAIELAGIFDIAEFQLGLLFLQTNKIEQAEKVFKCLNTHVSDPAITIFTQAYLALICDDNFQANKLFQLGIDQCTHNLPLKADMQRVLDMLSLSNDQVDTNFITSSKVSINSLAEPVSLTESKGSRFLGAYLNTLDDDHGLH
jgi:tetratricopeptide (TPR) repeat protein